MSRPTLAPLKTWSHLAGARRRPSEYEVVSVGLHYHTRHPECPWELDPNLFMNVWYREFREGSALRHPDWNAFRDPDAMIYRGYIKLQDEQETYAEALLDQHSFRGRDAALQPSWLQALARWYTPGRYARHALQMAAAYGGQMAPASTITNCFFFQAADEARLMQRIAYRTAELRKHCHGHGFGTGERRAWEEDPVWQGFRELLERALVAWDWGESFVAVNLVIKPALDEVTLRHLTTAAERNGDELLSLLCHSHRADVQRSRRWTAALVRMAAESGNHSLMQSWLACWVPLAERAIAAYLQDVPGLDPGPSAQEARAACFELRSQLGFTV